jgi:Rrf2 family protein
LTVLARAPHGGPITARRLAEYHGVPAPYLAKHLQALVRSGLVESVSGPRGGFRLARDPSAVTLLDVVEAVDGTEPAFRCTEIRQRGPLDAGPEAYRHRCGIASAFDAAEQAWRASLATITITALVESWRASSEVGVWVRGTTWISGTGT